MARANQPSVPSEIWAFLRERKKWWLGPIILVLVLKPEGLLVTCSCSFHFSEEIFLQTLEESARDARRRVHLIEKRMQASDHPILVGMPETYYLKCFILRVVE